MTINKVVPTDTNEQAFLRRLNPAIDVIPISINRAGKLLTLGLEGGGSFLATLLSAPNAISSGIEVSKGANNLSFNMSAGGYAILDIDYSAIATIIELTVGDPTNDRIDLIIANTAGSIIFKTGIAGASPLPPALLSTEILIASILVKSNATTVSTADVFIALSNSQAQASAFILSDDLGTPIEPTAATTLAGLTDVDLAGLVDGDLIRYNLSSLKWEVVPFAIANAEDTKISGPIEHDFLQYDPISGWKNTPDVVLAKKIVQTFVISVAISSNQTNYNPSGLNNCSILRLDSTGGGTNDISGFLAQESGRRIIVINTGPTTIRLKDNLATSLAANRFSIGADRDLNENESLELFYDGLSSRWRILGNL